MPVAPPVHAPLAAGLASVVLLVAAGCHTLRPVQPSQVSAEAGLRRVWVTQPDHSTIIVESPQIQGDTLTGFVYGEPESFPLERTTRIAVRSQAIAKTIALGLVGTGAALGALIYLENRPDVGQASACRLGAYDVPCCQTLPAGC